MKKIIALLAVFCGSLVLAATPIRECKCKGIALHGRVQVVTHHPDLKVQVVTHHADLHVRKVTHHPDACGEWQFVDSHPDFTVQFVDSHADFTIQWVDSYPGVQ